MMSGDTGIFVDPRKLRRMKQPPAFTVTRLCERVPREYRFRQPVRLPFCRVVILAGLHPRNMKTARLSGAAERANPPTVTGTRTPQPPRLEVVRAAVASVPRRTRRPKRHRPRLRARLTERPPRHPTIARRRRRGLGLSRAMPCNARPLDLARAGLGLQ